MIVHCAAVESNTTVSATVCPNRAYRDPMMMKHTAIAAPPITRGIRRPQRSTQICAGTVQTSITMPVTPEDKKAAFCEVKPACLKRIGA